MGVYKKLFGKVGTGKSYRSGGDLDGAHNSKSLRSALDMFRDHLHGGTAGKNLSKHDADVILSVIEPHLKKLPAGRRLSSGVRVSIGSKLWRMVKKGKISEEDYKDAKRILKQL